MFMILEMEDGGIDVENYLFNSAYQALFAFLQVCYTYIFKIKQIHLYVMFYINFLYFYLN